MSNETGDGHARNLGGGFVPRHKVTHVMGWTAWAALTAYSLGDLRKNGSNVYRVITAGTSAAAGGPTGTTADITDGTVHWEYVSATDPATTYKGDNARELRVGTTAGDVTVTMESGVDVTIPNVQIGESVVGAFSAIKNATTTARGITVAFP